MPFRAVRSVPSTVMVPPVDRSMVEMQFKRVVLPEPEAPMMPVNSPSSTVKLRSLRAWVRLPLAP